MAQKKLQKQLRLFDVFAISTGAMFSSGFFLLPGLAAAQTGASVYLAYLASGLLIIPAMMSVAELATAMPKAGGAYYFLDRSLGPAVGTVGGLGSWAALMFKSAFALIGMGAYLSLYVDMSFTALALILTVVFGVLNIFGAKETTWLQRVLVATLIVIMGIFLVQGLAAIAGMDLSAQPQEYERFFRGELHGFISTIGLVFVSYAGLTKVASVAEEIENPDRTIPLAMGLSLLTAITIYVLGVYVMLMVLEPSEFFASLTPVADAGAKFMHWLPGSAGVAAIVIAAVAAFASTGNAGIMSASRYPFAMARDQLVSPALGKVGKTGTPVLAISVTVGLMMVILLVFDVAAVAKLASAFQLLLFGLLCFSVIVMRESRIDSYRPGFRSPLYPWMQIAGMLISVWLIAEMGLLAVALTGVIVVLCLAWYQYYAGPRVERQGAIFHVHERLGRKRYDALEYELLSILNEKNGDQRLAYEEVVARSLIVDLDGRDPDRDLNLASVLEEAADRLAQRVGREPALYREAFGSPDSRNLSYLGHGVACAFEALPGLPTAEMVVFRFSHAFELEVGAGTQPKQLHALVLMIIPEEVPGLGLRLVGHLAEIVQAENFLHRWLEAENAKSCRQVLMSDEHFLHVRVQEHPVLRSHIGSSIGEVPLPGESLVALIYRRGRLVIPHGDTRLTEEDELALIGNPDEIRLLTEGLNTESDSGPQGTDTGFVTPVP